MSNVLGNISFQANDKMDVFHVAQVVNEGIEPSDNTLLQIEDSQFDSDKAWVTGNVPKIKPVHVEGDKDKTCACRGRYFHHQCLVQR